MNTDKSKKIYTSIHVGAEEEDLKLAEESPEGPVVSQGVDDDQRSSRGDDAIGDGQVELENHS